MAAHPIATSMTAEDFLRVYGEEDDNFRRFELIDGEVYERTVPGSPHDVVKNNVKELFDRSGLDRNVFRCWIEHTFRMADLSVVTPDIAIARTERLLHRKGFTPGAPDIAFEVAVNDNPGVLQSKITGYLSNGADAVCCVYPERKIIVIYTPGAWRELTETDALEFPALLPGISIPISAIFEGV
jgi:Uma2 family endonuclease